MSNLRTPLYQWHVDHKARMVPFGGWDMPVQYAGIAIEHKAVRTGAGLFDISHMARVSFGGPDSLALLEKVFTNSVGGMKDMQVRYGLVCKEDGGILDDILVYRWPYGFAAVINAGNREKIIAWLEKHRAGLNVQMQDQTFDTTMVAVQGPKAVELVAGMFADDVAKLKYYYAQPTRYRDKGCVVSRTGYTGEDGFEVMVPNALGTTLWEEFVDKGRGAVRARGPRHAPPRGRDAALRPRTDRGRSTRSRPGWRGRSSSTRGTSSAATHFEPRRPIARSPFASAWRSKASEPPVKGAA